MPAKQTRESIEAELNAGESERAQQLLSKVIQDFHELEKDLRQLEDEAGLPAFYRSKPLTERMAAVGMSQAVIDRIKKYVDALEAVESGRQDELPDHLKSELAARADAEQPGELAGIVKSHRQA
jgi:flagellar biosynthesis chaperone FliJ